MKIALCQTGSLPLKEEVLTSYFKYLQKDSIAVFGEYAFDLFFNELQQTPKELIAQFSTQKLALLKKMAKNHKVKIITPLIVVEEGKIYKKIAIIDSKSTQFYMQQKLINYQHWNEEKFFDNPKVRALKMPFVFEQEGLKVAVLFGFELHFDALWLKLKEQGVDIVLLPTACTFGSQERWQALCKSRAFCNSAMVVRVNRVGKATFENQEAEFYGESFIIDPSAQFVERLDSKESIVCFEVTKEEIDSQVLEWGFRKITKGRK